MDLVKFKNKANKELLYHGVYSKNSDTIETSTSYSYSKNGDNFTLLLRKLNTRHKDRYTGKESRKVLTRRNFSINGKGVSKRAFLEKLI